MVELVVRCNCEACRSKGPAKEGSFPLERLCRNAPTHTIVILERSEESNVCAMLRNSRFFGCASE